MWDQRAKIEKRNKIRWKKKKGWCDNRLSEKRKRNIAVRMLT